MRNTSRTLLAAAALAAAGAASAGTVEVSISNPDRFVDAGTSEWEEQDNLRALAGHLQQLGARMLPPGQKLAVEVLDVDLAGDVKPSRRDGSPTRFVSGRTDYPRMHVRYTLTEGGRVVRSGDEWVMDMHYGRGLPLHRDFSGLGLEKRMLDRWFATRVVGEGEIARVTR